MAKIQEEYVIVKISKLLKGNEDAQTLMTSDLQSAIEEVVTQVVGGLIQDPSVIVEVEDPKSGS